MRNSRTNTPCLTSSRGHDDFNEPDGVARWVRLLGLAIVMFCTFFVNNGVLVPDIMESRNLITAREMLEKENYLVPTMNGEIRIAKPPLPTWVSAAIEYVSPDNIALQRCAAGTAGVILTIFVYLYALRILRIDPLWPTLILLTCYNFVLMGRTVSWDIYCHAFMTAGIYFLARGLQSRRRAIGAFIWSGFFTALSIMSKGPVSLYALLLPWLIATLTCMPASMKGKWGSLCLMILLTLIVGCWWYGYIYIFHSDELQAVAAQESGAWIHRNVRPFWYYHLFYLESGIWAPILLTSIFLSFTRKRRRISYLPLIWMAAALILLSLLPEKKTRYLLPVLIPAALLMGQQIYYWQREFMHRSSIRNRDKVLYRINTWIFTIISALLPAAAWWFCYRTGEMHALKFFAITVIAEMIAVSLGYAACKLRPAVMVWSIALLFCTAEVLALPSVKPWINNPEMHSIRIAAARPELKGIQFYSNIDDELRIELVYAARRDITPTAFTDSALSHLPLPAVVMTHKGATAELPASFLNRVDTTYLGRYDDNRRPRSSSRYDGRFIYHLTLISPRKL